VHLAVEVRQEGLELCRVGVGGGVGEALGNIELVKVSLGSCLEWHGFGLAYFFQAFEAELFSTLLKPRGRWCDWERGDKGEQGHKGHEDEGAHVACGNDWWFWLRSGVTS
jgi:hypothetical protein